MQTHPAKRASIIIEAPMETRLTEALARAGVAGFTVLPVLGGSGRSGRQSREGQVGRAGMVTVICLIRPERLDRLLEEAFAVVERQIGLVSVTDAEVPAPRTPLKMPPPGLDGALPAGQDRP